MIVNCTVKDCINNGDGICCGVSEITITEVKVAGLIVMSCTEYETVGEDWERNETD